MPPFIHPERCLPLSFVFAAVMPALASVNDMRTYFPPLGQSEAPFVGGVAKARSALTPDAPAVERRSVQESHARRYAVGQYRAGDDYFYLTRVNIPILLSQNWGIAHFGLISQTSVLLLAIQVCR